MDSLENGFFRCFRRQIVGRNRHIPTKKSQFSNEAGAFVGIWRFLRWNLALAPTKKWQFSSEGAGFVGMWRFRNRDEIAIFRRVPGLLWEIATSAVSPAILFKNMAMPISLISPANTISSAVS